jgi:hypothetical protein
MTNDDTSERICDVSEDTCVNATSTSASAFNMIARDAEFICNPNTFPEINGNMFARLMPRPSINVRNEVTTELKESFKSVSNNVATSSGLSEPDIM